MKKFTFKLDVVLKQRKREEEMAQKEFALVSLQVKQAHEKIQNHQKEIKYLLDETMRQRESQIDIDNVIDSRRFIETLYIEVDQFKKELSELHKVFREKQENLIKASQKRQALTKLKESQYDKWYREFLRLDQKEMDEIAAQVFRREVS